jgi:hypothetical protein
MAAADERNAARLAAEAKKKADAAAAAAAKIAADAQAVEDKYYTKHFFLENSQVLQIIFLDTVSLAPYTSFRFIPFKFLFDISGNTLQGTPGGY